MKKSLLLLGAFALILQTQAQNVVFEDNFDSYTAGQGVTTQSDDWYTWNSGDTGTDAEVSTAQAVSGANSIIVDQTAGTDIVYDTGVLTSGKYDVKFKMYIPSGKEGYFNLLHAWEYTSTTGYEWAVDVYFSSGGDLTWTAGGADGGAASFNHDTWMDIQVTANMDADEGSLYLDGALIYTWAWSLNNANGNPGMNQLKAIDFFGYGPSGANGQYYIDDFQVIESTSVAVPTVTSDAFMVYPNPANDVVYFNLGNLEQVNVNIYALDGKLVRQLSLQASNGQHQADVSSLEAGIYFVEYTSGKVHGTQKLVIK